MTPTDWVVWGAVGLSLLAVTAGELASEPDAADLWVYVALLAAVAALTASSCPGP